MKIRALAILLPLLCMGMSSGKLKEAPKEYKNWKLVESRSPFEGLHVFEYKSTSSGLRLFLIPRLGSKVVAYVTGYNVGSRFEKEGKTGLAHLFEHMTFRGTRSYEKPFQLLSSFGGHWNAYTSRDVTVYHQTVPVEIFPKLAHFEAERMRHLKIDQAGFDQERGAVVSERKMRTEDAPFGRLYWELFQYAFKKHPYKTGVIGWQKDLENMSLQDAKDFYKMYYAPNRAVMALAGDFQVKDALKVIDKEYGAFKSEKFVAPKIPVEPSRKRNRRAVIPLKAESVMIADAHKGLTYNDPNVAAEILTCVLFSNSSIGYLSNELVEKGLAKSVSASCSPSVDPALSTFFIVGNPGDSLKKVERAFDNSKKGFLKWLTKERVESLKLYFLADQWSQLRDPMNLAMDVATSAVETPDPYYSYALNEAVQKVSLEQIKDRWAAWKKLKKTRVIIKPSKKNMPFKKRK